MNPLAEMSNAIRAERERGKAEVLADFAARFARFAATRGQPATGDTANNGAEAPQSAGQHADEQQNAETVEPAPAATDTPAPAPRKRRGINFKKDGHK